MQAIILAAGMGKRLKELTSDATKCMVKVNGVTLIERMLGQLDSLGLTRIVIVVGYQGEKLINYIAGLNVKTPITYVDNPIYFRTNNIYSLYLACNYLTEDDTLLLESDLIFDDSVLHRLTQSAEPNLALVAKYESWMDGTVVTIDNNNNILRFIDVKHFNYDEIPFYYKTVNIYKFSRAFSQTQYVPFLEAYCKALGNNEYYEQVLKIIINLDNSSIRASVLTDELWYEIDDVQDLDIASSIFQPSISGKLDSFQKRYGGYWRYPHMLDFCYLVNPYFPTPELINEMKASFETLLRQYPSGIDINCLLAAKYFGVDQDMIVVGNGAAEIIKALVESAKGNVGVISPTFEEYPNRKPDSVVRFSTAKLGYRYNAADIIGYFDTQDIQTLVVITPDNPSGNALSREDVIRVAKWANEKDIRLILDESFIDFSENDSSVMDKQFLCGNTNTVIVKSISKSFGVPGLRLGIAVSCDAALISDLKKDMSIWNINSFAEFYMQIFEKYKQPYGVACKRLAKARSRLYDNLCKIDGIRALPSEANYIMCEVTNNIGARALTEAMLHQFNILIKDLSEKKGIEGDYIRVAVRDDNDNERLVNALKTILMS